MPARSKQSAVQPQLEGMDVSEEGWWRCRGVFSANYINRYLRNSEHIPKPEDCRELYSKVRSLWLDNLAGLRNNNEAYTRTRFLDVVLKELEWFFIPEQIFHIGKLRKRPDYCLFPDEITEQKAAAEKDVINIFRASTTVLEAKKAELPLDQKEDKKSDAPGLYPSQQAQEYLRAAKDERGRFFDWAILTNGNEWRLYCENAAVDGYFAFDLAQGNDFCPLEEFCLFVAFFRRMAFDKTGSRCLLDDFREQSLTHQEELENNLRKRIFNVLEELAEGFYFNPENQLTAADLTEVYDNALIFLYRLLFILYAESRGLLPTKPSGPQCNHRYRQEFSLQRFVEKLRDQKSYPDDVFHELYDDLIKLYNLINGTNKAQNQALQVTRYNGGLFNPGKHPLLEQWHIGDKTLSSVLRQLIFAQPPARGRNSQQSIRLEETVDYGTLEVRQLGDIYEGLLGGKLALRNNRLELVDDDGENHAKGIFYTPDWIVNYLIRETLMPLLDAVATSAEVTVAMKKQSTEGKQDNSFALGVLALNIVDPAMGSGHFLGRATEWLAEQIVYHPTTREMTETITAKRPREAIIEAKRTPVPAGISQEDAETAYWRRRVVENCIYGVDTNSLAVELAKLSLWLTCIAIDEPLSFLDHHLRAGNSLLSAEPEETNRLPVRVAEEKEDEILVDIGDSLKATLRNVIEANMQIQGEASTEMDVVKAKEQKWRNVQEQLEPYRQTLNLWFAALDGLKLEGAALNAFDYRLLALRGVPASGLEEREQERAEVLWQSIEKDFAAKVEALCPFHWRVEFPAVFYQPDGSLKPPAERGFDAVLGNPPYISTHTSSAAKWRCALERRTGYLDDLYVHFTGLGFDLLRRGGGFGFIVSDTFFTLASKERMRVLLQENRLTHLGQCDPFNATVDAAIFVARKEWAKETDRLLFVQARPHARGEKPERDLAELPAAGSVKFDGETEEFKARHGRLGSLRVHEAPVMLYREAFKRAFFEPRPAVLNLYQRFNEPVKILVDQWWESIENSQKFADNSEEIRDYQAALKPGDVTLVGLIAEGGQGMRTANNARFLGYREGTKPAKELETKRAAWTNLWLADAQIAPVFLRLLREVGGDPAHPLKDGAAWEACIEPMKALPAIKNALGFGRGDLYRIVPAALIADESDFRYAWERRKPELLRQWQTHPALNPYWQQADFDGEQENRQRLRTAKEITDAEFCALCVSLQGWIKERREQKTKPAVPRDALGLRSSENYTDPADAPRIATIYNGLRGRGQFVSFRKGDPDGNKWADNEPLYVDWSAASVNWLFTSPEARWQGHTFFFTAGVTWTAVANHVPMKARFQQPCVFDADSMRLTPNQSVFEPLAFLALLNSHVVSYLKMKFVKHTQKWEIGDLRSLPLVMPTSAQSQTLTTLAERAIEAKRLTFGTDALPNALVDFTRRLSAALTASAPKYLQPPAQLRLLSTASDCLATIELAVHWEAEKLYGVEGCGPFDEF